jgi:hypothetical protein
MHLHLKILPALFILFSPSFTADLLKFSDLGNIAGFWEQTGYTVLEEDGMQTPLETWIVEIRKTKLFTHCTSPDTNVCFVNKITIKKGKGDEIILVKGGFPNMAIDGMKRSEHFIEISQVNDTLIKIYTGRKFPNRRAKYTYYYKKIPAMPDWWPKKIGKPAKIGG